MDDSFKGKQHGNNKLIRTLENHILFLEEEIRRKNDFIEKILNFNNCSEKNTSEKPTQQDVFSQQNVNVNFRQKNPKNHTSRTDKSPVGAINDHLNDDTPTSYTAIIGDSIVKEIKGWQMSKSVGNNEKIIVKSFSGATTQDMESYILPSIEKKPQRIIIHTGTNDLKSDLSPNDIAGKIINLALKVNEHDIIPFISAIIPRDDNFNVKANEVNKCLHDHCQSRNIGFISHDNLDSKKHLNGSKLHPNKKGTSIISKNLLHAIKD